MASATTTGRLFCFGLGYVALTLATRLLPLGWRVAGTSRSADKRARLAALGVATYAFDGGRPLEDAAEALAGATHILSSVAPDSRGDPVLRHHADDIAALAPEWTGYLSSTVVYGDSGGGWVDERMMARPTGERGRRRAEAELEWVDLHRDCGLNVHVFRLAGIYGPGRSALDRVRDGTARRIVKPGHVFSRIHVEDVAATLMASLGRPDPGAVYNVCDDEPAPGNEVVEYACRIAGAAPPPAEPFDEAILSATARSFFADGRKVSNARIKRDLGVTLAFPDYRAGLDALLARTGTDS